MAGVFPVESSRTRAIIKAIQQCLELRKLAKQLNSTHGMADHVGTRFETIEVNGVASSIANSFQSTLDGFIIMSLGVLTVFLKRLDSAGTQSEFSLDTPQECLAAIIKKICERTK